MNLFNFKSAWLIACLRGAKCAYSRRTSIYKNIFFGRKFSWFFMSLLNKVSQVPKCTSTWVSRCLSAVSTWVSECSNRPAQVPECPKCSSVRMLKKAECSLSALWVPSKCPSALWVPECPPRALRVLQETLDCHWHYHWTKNIPLKCILSK